MTLPSSRVGLVLSGAYVVLSIALVSSQGLFGESFITLILGLPWTLVLAFFEFFGASNFALYVLAVGPMVLNAILLYFFGAFLEKRFTK